MIITKWLAIRLVYKVSCISVHQKQTKRKHYQREFKIKPEYQVSGRKYKKTCTLSINSKL